MSTGGGAVCIAANFRLPSRTTLSSPLLSSSLLFSALSFLARRPPTATATIFFTISLAGVETCVSLPLCALPRRSLPLLWPLLLPTAHVVRTDWLGSLRWRWSCAALATQLTAHVDQRMRESQHHAQISVLPPCTAAFTSRRDGSHRMPLPSMLIAAVSQLCSLLHSAPHSLPSPLPHTTSRYEDELAR